MANVAISVDGVSKRYRLGVGPDGRGDFREAAAAVFRRGARRVRRRNGTDAPSDADELWALRDVSFTVNTGEVVGIIGHNGAGKSTLLKILSRVTDPTSGEAWFEGRIGSLLEVGTGFHPELTGRDNVYLSGAVLGMSRREIDSKFDEIVAFSEIGRYIDTPVKRYSSGMYVRLGFAVAAHLEPEVLIVDEVLAVGDASFQRKCLAKMQSFAESGRTILFVSHNMGSVQSLCHRAVVLKNGRLVAEGPPSEAAALYLRSTAEQGGAVSGRTDRRGRGRTRIAALSIHVDGHEDATGLLVYGQTAVIECEVTDILPDLACSFTILNHLAQRVCRFSSRSLASMDALAGGRRFRCEIPELPLVPGHYHLNVSLFCGREIEDSVDSAAVFDVEHGALRGRPLTRDQRGVVCAPAHVWTVPAAQP